MLLDAIGHESGHVHMGRVYWARACPNRFGANILFARRGGAVNDDCRKSLAAWAAANGNVSELWLFGSRAKGTSQPDSDVDIAVALIPPQGKHNWALANYVDLKDQWQDQLHKIVCCEVDLCLILPDTTLDSEVRTTGKLLWQAS